MLGVRDLQIFFYTDRGVARAVDGASFSVNRGEVVGLVGESGCGKSVAAMSILGIVAHPGKIAGGKVMLDDQDLIGLSPRDMQYVRGGRIGIVFQDPMTALNPAIRIGEQVAEVLRAHEGKAGMLRDMALLMRTGKGNAAWKRAIASLDEVGIPAPSRRAFDFPHEFSGGLRQRIVMAAAVSGDPEFLIADEPTTALDVTVQAQILELMAKLKDMHNMGILLITHDLGVVAQICDRAAVMYAGHVVEEGAVDQVLHESLHPYTKALLECVPSSSLSDIMPEGIPGAPPDPLDMPEGCRFQPRCSQSRDGCELPQEMRVVGGRRVRCLLYD